jgi:hypothetical protein
MTYYVALKDLAKSRTIGIRALAVPIRVEACQAIAQGEDVIFDFSGVGVTQSFVDELIGSVILKEGPTVLSKMVFKGCSVDVRAILKFVTADRSQQFARTLMRPKSLRHSQSYSLATCIA